MALDPCFDTLLADPRNVVRRPPAHVPLEKVRKAANAAMIGVVGPNMHSIEQMAADLNGSTLPLRLYRPTADRKLPLIVFCHGGGWVWGNLDTHDAICREIAAQTGAAVASLDYRLAPEVHFPGQIEDVLGGVRWLAQNAARLELDPSRLALCGDSAGGCLAVAAAMQFPQGEPKLRHLGLFYPALDARCSSASQSDFAGGYMLTREAMQWFWEAYLGDPANGTNPLATPARAYAEDLRGLPRVTIFAAEFDILRDEGEAFASCLEAAGVPVRLRRYDGMIHGYLSLPVAAEPASRTIGDLAADIREAFAADEGANL